jgi:hypothetical protein
MNDFSDLLYVMGAIVIFGLLLISVNQSMMRNNLITVGNEQEYTAIALANSIIEEARVTRFDQNNGCTTSDFTMPANLGPDAGEAYISLGRSNFNDFDDFHGLQITEATDSGVFDLSAEVYYVQRDAPGTPVGIRTPHKRLDVTVSGNTLESSVVLTYLKSCR